MSILLLSFKSNLIKLIQSGRVRLRRERASLFAMQNKTVSLFVLWKNISRFISV